MELFEEKVDLGICQKQSVATRLVKMFDQQLHTDVTFLVGEGGRVRVCGHRIVLASQSDYFDCLLYGPMKEGRASEITLPDTPVEAFRELLRFLYSGSITSISLSTALDLHVLADRFGVPGLKDSIEAFLVTIVSVKNVLHFHTHAQVSSALRLQQKCERFMDQHAREVIRSGAVPCLPRESLKMLVARDTFVVEELQIFHAVRKWMEHNGVDRGDAADLLECVRLSEIPYLELKSEVLPSGLYDRQQVLEAVGTSESVEYECMSTRGKKGGDDLNLFAVKGTELTTCVNYLPDVLPERNDDWSCVSDLVFTLTVSAAQDPAHITVKFDDVYIVNQMLFEGYSPDTDAVSTSEASRENSPFCYQIWVSRDGDQWLTILDYSRLKCFSVQRLFFNKMAIRYVRILQSKGREGFKIQLRSCSYVGPVPYHFRELGVIAPFIPMTPEFRQYVKFSHNQSLARLFVTFSQPYSINTVRFKLHGLEGCGEVAVSVATQNRSKLYQLVAQHNDIDLSTSFEVAFHERPVSIISVTITHLMLPSQKPFPRSLDNLQIPEFSVQEFLCQGAEY